MMGAEVIKAGLKGKKPDEESADEEATESDGDELYETAGQALLDAIGEGDAAAVGSALKSCLKAMKED